MTELRNLQEIDLEASRCRVNDSELQVFALFLGQLTHLTRLKLHLEGNEISKSLDRLGAKLGEMPKLAHLDIDLSRNPVQLDFLVLFTEQLGSHSSVEALHLAVRHVCTSSYPSATSRTMTWWS